MWSKFFLIGMAAVVVAPEFVLAQGNGGETPVDEVIVVSGFRPQALADRSSSISVIDSGLIEARAAEHIEAVIGAAANVTMTSGASRGRFVQVRGVGDLEQFVDPKHYPSVGVSIDGIDVGGIASAAMLFDVEQIEILRGPQGTRFGAGALAGQINVISAAPTETFDAYIDAGMGNYGAATLGFAAGGSLADSVTGRIAVSRHDGDGYQTNAWLGRDDTNGFSESVLRASLAVTPSDTARIRLSALHFDADNGYDAFALDNSRTTLSDEPGQDDHVLTAFAANAQWSIGPGLLEANLNWLDSEVDYGFDEDWTYVGICDGTLCDPVFDFFSNTDRYVRSRDDNSLDLRWLGNSDSGAETGMRYTVGLYRQNRSENLARTYYGSFSSVYSVDRLAAYGEFELNPTPRISLTVGLRHEQFDDAYSDIFGFAATSDDDLTSGEVAFSYRFSERHRLYALESRGVRPGGINTEASGVMPLVAQRFQDFLASRLRFRREQLSNTEVGIVSLLAAGRLQLRSSLFRMSRDDAQLESWFWDPVNFLWVGVLDNADGSNSGAEFEVRYRVSDRWLVRGSLGLIDTSVAALSTFDLDLDDFVVRRDIEQAKAPDWQLYFGSEWTVSSYWRLTLDLEAADAHRYGYYHNGLIDRQTLMHGSVRRRFGDNEITLWVRNLLDEETAVHGLYFGNDPRKGWIPERYLQPGEPRLVGLSLQRNF